MRVGCTDDAVSLNSCVCDLNSYIFVRQAYNKTVFRRVVLVLVLESQALPGIVVGFTLATPAELYLVALEVLLVLDYLNETLKIND